LELFSACRARSACRGSRILTRRSCPRVDGAAVAPANVFLNLGVDLDETVAVMRVLIDGPQHAASMTGQAAFQEPGRSSWPRHPKRSRTRPCHR
jgi:Adenylate cyclase regulatory domain